MRTLVLLFLMQVSAVQAQAMVNPHYDQKSCGSCHLQEPSAREGGGMDYHFLGEEIDRTCNICHTQDCCTIAGPHQGTHPSGIDRWDERKYGRPKELPLFGGYITCATCHFWRRDNNPKPQDYKLVRLVDIRPTKIDWTLLCADCHKDH
ncbi:MAG TPA: hypothetical protein VN317_00335 [Candidatus Methanoperedens sp.]|nr:hypothetical protein [Candidatus Methanoperedens sp.]